MPSRKYPHLKEKRFFENQSLLRGGREPVQEVERNIVRWEVRCVQRRITRRQPQPDANLFRQMLGKVRRKFLQRVEHQPPLHLRSNRAGFFVDRHDPAGMYRLTVFVVEDLVLRIGQLQTAMPRISTIP